MASTSNSGIDFPLDFLFKITTFSNDFTAVDSSGKVVAYVRQKMFKFKEEIQIYNNESKSKIIFTIRADRWLDFSAAYSFFDSSENEIGKIVRKGWRSIWKSEYELVDQHGEIQFHIREVNAWIKVVDSIFGEIPFLGLLTGYFFNPSYDVTNVNNESIFLLKKEPSFWGRKFKISKKEDVDMDDELRVMLGLMMMILLERRRG